MEPIKVVIADAQCLVRVGLREVLSAIPDCEVVGEVLHEDQLLQLLSVQQPDVLILDHDQPDRFSVETIRKVRERSAATRILIISGDTEKERVFQVLETGVSSFLTKHCGEKEIADAMLATYRGEKFFCTNIVDYLLERSFPRASDTQRSGLSVREMQIVRLVAEGLVAKEIGDRLNLSTHTVYTHRKNIMKKLQISSTSELVLFAVAEGLV
ncbi:MAG: hypothetical protein RLY31_1988 [Bacteroidota bacterium]